MKVPGTMPHAEVKKKLRQQLMDTTAGDSCPTCEQHAQIYRRHINAGMAASLIRIYVVSQVDYVDITTLPARSREEGKFVYWGLLEEHPGRTDAGVRRGRWRLTDRGRLYVRNRLAVPYTALVYNDRCLGLEGPLVTITEALKQKFDYNDLMAGR